MLRLIWCVGNKLANTKVVELVGQHSELVRQLVGQHELANKLSNKLAKWNLAFTFTYHILMLSYQRFINLCL